MKKQLLTAIAFLTILTAKAQWQVQNAGFINDTLGFYEMSLPNQNTAWAVCYDGKAGLNNGRFILDFTRTTDGGATWVPGKMGNDHSLQFSNISAISETEAWVAMNKRFVTGGGLYHTTDGGVSWQQSGVGEIFDENSFPNFVHFKDQQHGIAMGDPNNGYFEIYLTDNKGKKWRRVTQDKIPAALPNEFGWISGYAAVGNTIWFGTSSGRMYKSENFGRDWTVHTVDPGGKFVMEIAFNDDKLHGVAHLRSNQTFLYSTADGGLTWTNLGQPVNWKSSRITAVPGTDALIATSVNFFDRGSSISYDNGSTWTIIESIVPKAVCRFFDANTGYAGSFFVTGPPLRGGIYKSQLAIQSSANNIVQRSVPQPIADAGLKVYPSPATDVLNIDLGDQVNNSNTTVKLIGADGRQIETRTSSGARSMQFDVSKLKPGMYIVRIESNGKITSKPVIVAR